MRQISAAGQKAQSPITRIAPMNLLSAAQTHLMAGISCPAPELEPPARRAGICFASNIMGVRIIKAAISLAAIATSAISVFAVSWICLAMLGY
jgi:hypothetical protein